MALHDMIGLGDDARMVEALNHWGIPVTEDQFTITTTSGIAAWELARKGFGCLPMADALASGFPDMQRLLPDHPITFPTWLVTHRDLHTSRRIRLVFDLLAEMLADVLTGSPE